MCLNETGVIFRIRKIGKGSVVLVDKIMNGKSEGGLTKQEKAISLFQFIVHKHTRNIIDHRKRRHAQYHSGNPEQPAGYQDRKHHPERR